MKVFQGHSLLTHCHSTIIPHNLHETFKFNNTEVKAVWRNYMLVHALPCTLPSTTITWCPLASSNFQKAKYSTLNTYFIMALLFIDDSLYTGPNCKLLVVCLPIPFVTYMTCCNSVFCWNTLLTHAKPAPLFCKYCRVQFLHEAVHDYPLKLWATSRMMNRIKRTVVPY